MIVLKLGNVDKVLSAPDGNQKLTVELEGVNEASVLNYMDIETVISHYGKTTLLDKIGRTEAVNHFKIKEKSDGKVQRRAQRREV